MTLHLHDAVALKLRAEMDELHLLLLRLQFLGVVVCAGDQRAEDLGIS